MGEVVVLHDSHVVDADMEAIGGNNVGVLIVTDETLVLDGMSVVVDQAVDGVEKDTLDDTTPPAEESPSELPNNSSPNETEIGGQAETPKADEVADQSQLHGNALKVEERASHRGGIDLAELVTAAKEGDKDAFTILVRATHSETYTLAYRLTGDPEDAQDVVQEAYLRAYTGLKKFRGDAEFTSWMYRIVANRANTELSKKSRHRHEKLDDEHLELPSGDTTAEQRLISADERSILNAALELLNAKDRAVVVLRDVYDLPHEAIAAELGITEGAAKVRVHRARRKLREALSPSNTAVATSQPEASEFPGQEDEAGIITLASSPNWKELSAIQQQVVILDEQGVPRKRIAETLDIGLKALGYALRTARQKLKREHSGAEQSTSPIQTEKPRQSLLEEAS